MAAVNIGQLFTLALDTVAPTSTLSIASIGAGSAFLNGTSLYYNGASAGNLQLQDTVTETGSGVTNVQFPALGGTTTGWSHTTQTISAPVGGPYVTTNNFAWNAGTSSGPTEGAVATDKATNATTTTLTFVNDIASPTGGAISGTSNGGAVTLTTTNYTDAGSGIASNIITRSNPQSPPSPVRRARPAATAVRRSSRARMPASSTDSATSTR